MAFIAVYAARLGATGFQISLLSAGPAIINLIFSLPAGHWLEGRVLTQVSYQSAAWHRLGYLLLIPLPLLLPNTTQVWIIVLITLIMSFPGTVLSIAFNAVLADLIPPEDRATVVRRRNALTSLAMNLTVLLLDHFWISRFRISIWVVLAGNFGGIFRLTTVTVLPPQSGRTCHEP